MIPTKQEIYETLCKRHTKEVQDQLMNARVAIAGLGGLGSTIAVSLTRAGVGHLHLIDFDKVDITNINRQQYTIHHIGRYKTDALREQLLQINPYLDIRIDTMRITKDTVSQVFQNDDIICEAFDVAEQKSMLVDAFFEYYKEDKILLSGTGMAGYESSNTIKTRKFGERFYLCGDGISDIQEGNCLMAPRVGICAGHEANMVIRLILNHTDV